MVPLRKKYQSVVLQSPVNSGLRSLGLQGFEAYVKDSGVGRVSLKLPLNPNSNTNPDALNA